MKGISVDVLPDVERRWCLHRVPVFPCERVRTLLQALLALGQSLVLPYSHDGSRLVGRKGWRD